MKRLILTLICITVSLFALSACGHEHSFGEWEIKKESTCATEGEKTRKCDCGETESAAIEKKNHKAVQISPIEPTCTAQGYTGGTYCEDCGVYVEEPKPLPPSHKYAPKVVSDPTCTAEGVNLFSKGQNGFW